MTTVLFLGGVGVVLGAIVGLVLRRPLRAVVGCTAVAGAYLVLVWTTASTDGTACHDCWEWHGRWAEWNLVALFAGANAVTLFATALVVGWAVGRRRVS